MFNDEVFMKIPYLTFPPKLFYSGLVCSLIFAGLFNLGCNRDKNPLEPGDNTTMESLHYDAGQLSSPLLAGGTYEAAARFTAAQIGDWAGGEIVEVQFYVANRPQTCEVKIYGANSVVMPGGLLYSADVSSATTANAWNTHTLTTPVTLGASDIWISIKFTHSALQPTIGCDPGPAVTDGDWLFSSADDAWMPFNQRSGISINWNIRGTVRVNN
jgi:hypothetical protein